MVKTQNEQTLETYRAKHREYVEGTAKDVSNHPKTWIENSLEGLPKDATIFEFGSGFGRDADFIRGLGYTVQTSDAVEEFVDLLKAQGKDAVLLNAITDELPNGVDLFFANAVLLHFTRDETRRVCEKVCAALQPGGRFALRLKKGDGEEWSDQKLGQKRYFCYWQPEQIETILKESGFSKVAIAIGKKNPLQPIRLARYHGSQIVDLPHDTIKHMKTFHVGIKAIVHDTQRGILLLKKEGAKGVVWEPPGGRINDDETFEQTLQRELGEELPGSQLESIQRLLGAYRLTFDIADGIGLVLLYFEVQAAVPDQVVISPEHTDFIWIQASSDIPETGVGSELRKILQKLL